MTRFLHTMSSICIWGLLVVISGALIYANWFRVEDGLMGFFFAPGNRFVAIGSGGVLLLICLLNLVTISRRRPKMQYISFDSDNGQVSISVSAVRDFVRKIGDEFGAVMSLDPKIQMEKKLISIDLNVKLQTGSRIPELSQMLQDRVRESIRDGLGIVDVREIKVQVQEIIGAPLPSKSE